MSWYLTYPPSAIAIPQLGVVQLQEVLRLPALLGELPQVPGYHLVADLPALPHRVVDGRPHGVQDGGREGLGVGRPVDAWIDLQVDQLSARPDHGLDVPVRRPGHALDLPDPALAVMQVVAGPLQ